MTPCRSRGRVGKLKPPLDARDAIAMGVEPVVDTGDVARDIREVPPRRGQVLAEISHVVS